MFRRQVNAAVPDEHISIIAVRFEGEDIIGIGAPYGEARLLDKRHREAPTKNSLRPRAESDHPPIGKVRSCNEQCSRNHDGVPSDGPTNIILVRSPNSDKAGQRRDREDQRAQEHPGRPNRQVTHAIDDVGNRQPDHYHHRY